MKEAKQTTGGLCDTVAHTPVEPLASSIADPRAVKSGQALRAALLNLLERKPFAHITIREIAAEAGVHYATFFRHHPAKEALLEEVAAEQINQMVALAMPVLDAADGHAAFLALARYVEANRALWTILLNRGAASAMRAELLRVARLVAAERAPAESWVPVDLAVICTVSLIVEIISWWLAQPPGEVSVAQVADYLQGLVLPPPGPGKLRPA